MKVKVKKKKASVEKDAITVSEQRLRKIINEELRSIKTKPTLFSRKRDKTKVTPEAELAQEMQWLLFTIMVTLIIFAVIFMVTIICVGYSAISENPSILVTSIIIGLFLLMLIISACKMAWALLRIKDPQKVFDAVGSIVAMGTTLVACFSFFKFITNILS